MSFVDVFPETVEIIAADKQIAGCPSLADENMKQNENFRSDTPFVELSAVENEAPLAIETTSSSSSVHAFTSVEYTGQCWLR